MAVELLRIDQWPFLLWLWWQGSRSCVTCTRYGFRVPGFVGRSDERVPRRMVINERSVSHSLMSQAGMSRDEQG